MQAQPQQITVNGQNRTYYATGNLSSPTALLVFHGGGETAGYGDNGILGYSGLDRADALVLSFQGQKANNGYSWLNAFPWLLDTPSNTAYYRGSSAVPDDVQFVAAVLQNYRAVEKIYATGKSDGAGFVALLIDRFLSVVPIRAAAVCSAALFYTTTGTVPLPLLKGVPFLEMHGDSDQVMPYNGAFFANENALKMARLWKVVDPSTTHTDTAGPYDWLAGVSAGQPVVSSIGGNPVYSWPGAVQIKVVGGNHDWFGHKDSGPGSDTPASLAIDATAVVCRFLGISYPGTPPPYLSAVSSSITPAAPIVVVPSFSPVAPAKSFRPPRALLILGIVTLVLSVLFLIWSIVIIIRCGKNPDKKPLFDALIALLVLSLVFSWVPGLGQLLTLGLLITVIIGTVRC